MISHVAPQPNTTGRRRLRIAVVIASLAAAVAGSIGLATNGSEERATTRGVTATLHTPGLPEFAAAGLTTLWISTRGRDVPSDGFTWGRLVQINLATGTVRRTVQLPGQTASLLRYGNHLIADPAYAGIYNNVYSSPGELLAIDWQTGRILARRHEQPGDGPLAVGGGRLWAVVEKPPKILDLNPNTFTPLAPALPLGTGRLFGLTWGDGYVWATAGDDGEVLRIDPSTRTITRAHVGGFPIGITLAGGSVWVIDNAHDTVLRLNPNTLQAIGHPIATPSGGAFYLGATGGYVFIANQANGTITRIDDQTGNTAGPPIRIAPSSTNANYSAAYAIAPAGTAIWATSPTTDTVSRIQARP
jgi:hypothetical protein